MSLLPFRLGAKSRFDQKRRGSAIGHRPHNVFLLTAAEGAVGSERGHDAIVTEVLAPRLHGFNGATGLLA